jgi:transposase-like protein
VATLFPNEASCERLVTAIAMEISEEWVTARLKERLINPSKLGL